jgi:hypothetical protein
VRQQLRHGLAPPRQAAQIRLVQGVVAPGQVHARQGGAHLLAMEDVGRQDVAAVQPVAQRSGFAADLEEDLAGRIGLGSRHRNAAL